MVFFGCAWTSEDARLINSTINNVTNDTINNTINDSTKTLNDTTKLNDTDTTKYPINFDVNVNDWE